MSLSQNLSRDTLMMVLKSIMSGGFLGEAGIRNVFVNLVNKTFEECSVGSMKKINCIKAVRQCTHLGLRDAKFMVDDYERRMVSRDALVSRLEKHTFYGDSIDPSLLNEWANESTRGGVDVDALKQACIDMLVNAQLDEDIPF